jgi:hypothetical protein
LEVLGGLGWNSWIASTLSSVDCSTFALLIGLYALFHRI